MRILSWCVAWTGLMVASAIWAQAPAAADAQPDASARGALLYQTHCTACHTKEMHWRDNRKAVNWPSLKAEVRRWQANASLQ